MGEMVVKCLIGAFMIYFAYFLTFVEDRGRYRMWGAYTKFKKPYERVILTLTLIGGISFGGMFILDGLKVIHIGWLNK